MPALDVGNFLKNTAPAIAHRTAAACGYEYTQEEVYRVFFSDGDFRWDSKNRYMAGLRDCIRFSVLNVGRYYRLDHVLDLGRKLLSSVGDCVLPISFSQEYTLRKEIEQLHQIEDKKLQALVACTYVYGMPTFSRYSMEVGICMANEILLGNMIGFISISPTDISEFKDARQVFYAGDKSKLFSVLSRNIVPLM